MLVCTYRRAWFAAMLFFALFTFAQPKFDTWFLSPHYLLKFRNNTVTAHNLNNNVSIYDQNSQSSIVIDSVGKIEVMIDERNLYDTLGNIIKNNLKCSNTGMGILLPIGKNKYINFMSCDYDTLKYRIFSKSNTIEVSKPKTFFPFLDSTTKDRQNWGLYSSFYYPISHGTSNCSGIRTIIQSSSGNIGVFKTDTSENKIKFNILRLSDIVPPVLNLNYTIEGIGFSNDYKQFMVATENYLNLYGYDDIDSKTLFKKKIRIPDGVFSRYINFITFSPSNKFVYLFGSNGFPSLTTSALYQLNLETNSFNKIYEEERNYIMRGLPLGIDGKIYLTDNQAGSFSIIHKPDLPFPDCNYVAEALKISPNYTYFLVSKKVENYYGRKYDFKISQTCIGDSVLFEGPKMATDDQYIWRFADGFMSTLSGVKRHISQEQKIHLRYNYCDVYDTAWVHPIKPNLTMPTTLVGCIPSVVTINPSFAVNLKQNILWNDNSNLPIKIVTTSGVYVLTISNNCFTEQDSTEVQFYEKPKITQPTTDTTFCEGQQVTITSNYPIYYTNQNKAITTFLGIKTAGNYAITSANACYTTTSSLSLKTDAIPRFLLPNDTLICDQTSYNATVVLNKADGTFIKWNDGTTENFKTITQAGEYEIILKNTCGIFKKAFAITFAKSNGGFINTNVLTPNGDEKNDTWQPLTENADKYQLQIYNRYGTLVFESTTWNQAWNASNSPDGIYFYHISYTDCNNQTQSIKGTVMVVR